MSASHMQIAQQRAGGVHEWQTYEGSTDATNIAAIIDAQVEATLALAYEARTANLIALWANPESATKDLRGNAVTWSVGEDRIGRLLEEIQQRLGVDK